jgi:hypothetical protein
MRKLMDDYRHAAIVIIYFVAIFELLSIFVE